MAKVREKIGAKTERRVKHVSESPNSIAELAKELGLTEYTIRAMRNRTGYYKDKYPDIPIVVTPRYGNSKVADHIYQQVVAPDANISAIAKATGAKYNTLYIIRRRYLKNNGS